ncbi:MAG: ATP-binding response regulator [Longimicrobiales bacterium]
MAAAYGTLLGPEQEESITILVLEDDPADRIAIERLVQREGLPWTLRWAETVAEGLRCVGDGGLDLAVLDHRLPDGTGFDLLSHLGATPYVFVTDGRETAVAIKALKGGASDVLLKDRRRGYVDLLPSVVRGTVALRRLRDQVRSHQEELETRVEERTREAREAALRLRALAARLVSIREEERRSFAREIHDELGQGLTGLRMDLALLRSELVESDRASAARLAECIATIDQSIDLVRGLSSRLYPPILDILGLGPALEGLVGEYQGRNPVRFHVDINCVGPDLGSPQALALYRVAQEALTNVIRHAKAEHVWVSLHEEGNGHVMEIRDDGKGGAPERISSTSTVGLLGMRERILEFGGVFTIDSPAGGGTVVRARIGPSVAGDVP